MEFFLAAHSFLRVVILALGIVGILRCLVSLATRQARFARFDEALARVYSGALDLQVVVGAALILFLAGAAQPVPWIHPILMLPAVVISHLGRRYRDRPEPQRHKIQLALYAASLLFVAVGLAVIGQLLPRR